MSHPCPIPRRVIPIRSAIVALLAAWIGLGSMQGWSATGYCRDLALLAAVVAAIDGRYRAMLSAAALAIGLDATGMMLMPFVVGLAIRQQVSVRDMALAPLALLPGLTVPRCPGSPTGGLWALAHNLPDSGISVSALLAATAIGAAAWYVAGLTARPIAGQTLIGPALLGTLGFAILAPTGADTLGIPLALAALSGDRRSLALVAVAAGLAWGGLPMLALLPLSGVLTMLVRETVIAAGHANDNAPLLRRTAAV